MFRGTCRLLPRVPGQDHRHGAQPEARRCGETDGPMSRVWRYSSQQPTPGPAAAPGERSRGRLVSPINGLIWRRDKICISIGRQVRSILPIMDSSPALPTMTSSAAPTPPRLVHGQSGQHCNAVHNGQHHVVEHLAHRRKPGKRRVAIKESPSAVLRPLALFEEDVSAGATVNFNGGVDELHIGIYSRRGPR
jgi:hypothetical protein